MEDSTDYPEITTEDPYENTEITDPQNEEQEIQVFPEEEVSPDMTEDFETGEDILLESQVTEVRKRRAASEDEHKEHQHLENPEEVDSSLLPVEHRGLDDDEDLDSMGNYSFKPQASWIFVSSSLLLFIGSAQLIQRYA